MHAVKYFFFRLPLGQRANYVIFTIFTYRCFSGPPYERVFRITITGNRTYTEEVHIRITP
jgi:hypothetical protein